VCCRVAFEVYIGAMVGSGFPAFLYGLRRGNHVSTGFCVQATRTLFNMLMRRRVSEVQTRICSTGSLPISNGYCSGTCVGYWSIVDI
jgi:hypothetical protein